MNTEYYIPHISEFHVGFEYEIKGSSGFALIDLSKNEEVKINWDRTFKKCIWGVKEESPFGDGIGMLKHAIKDETVRVKYLDEEDIESLGFKTISTNWWKQTDIGRSWQILKCNDTEYNISYGEHEHSKTYFEGNIKNKSELIKLMKQLGI